MKLLLTLILAAMLTVGCKDTDRPFTRYIITGNDTIKENYEGQLDLSGVHASHGHLVGNNISAN